MSIWRELVTGIIVIGVVAWLVVDYQGATQVISAGAGGFNTSVRALEPPQAAGAALPAGA